MNEKVVQLQILEVTIVSAVSEMNQTQISDDEWVRFSFSLIACFDWKKNLLLRCKIVVEFLFKI